MRCATTASGSSITVRRGSLSPLQVAVAAHRQPRRSRRRGGRKAMAYIPDGTSRVNSPLLPAVCSRAVPPKLNFAPSMGARCQAHHHVRALALLLAAARQQLRRAASAAAAASPRGCTSAVAELASSRATIRAVTPAGNSQKRFSRRPRRSPWPRARARRRPAPARSSRERHAGRASPAVGDAPPPPRHRAPLRHVAGRGQHGGHRRQCQCSRRIASGGTTVTRAGSG